MYFIGIYVLLFVKKENTLPHPLDTRIKNTFSVNKVYTTYIV